MAGPNQTGQTLTNPISQALGYAPALQTQVTDDAEEKRKKAMQDAVASAPGAGAISGLFGA